ncbi:MAG: metal ABC transporter permease [Bacilli bacterium]|nr:metal ABC transporter permease [Bacilli bacterium]
MVSVVAGITLSYYANLRPGASIALFGVTIFLLMLVYRLIAERYLFRIRKR